MEFAKIIRDRMGMKGWSVPKLAEEIGRSPEHARKICNGKTFPSDDLAERIATKLEMDPAEFKERVAADRWQKKYKKRPPQTERMELGPLEKIWMELDSEQREYLLCVGNCLMMRRPRRA